MESSGRKVETAGSANRGVKFTGSVSRWVESVDLTGRWVGFSDLARGAISSLSGGVRGESGGGVASAGVSCRGEELCCGRGGGGEIGCPSDSSLAVFSNSLCRLSLSL